MNLCARIAKSLRPEVQEAILEIDPLTDLDNSSGASSAQTASDSLEMHKENDNRSSAPDRQLLREHPIADTSKSEVKPQNKVDVEVVKVINEVLGKFFLKIDECDEAKETPLSLLHKLQIIDSGGQPQFHEVLPIFLRKMSIYVFVFKLSEELSSYPLVEYFEAGVKVGKSYTSKHTTEQLFQHLLRTVHTHQYSRDEDQDRSRTSRILLFGTHRDPRGKV